MSKPEATRHPDPFIASRIAWLSSQKHFDGCTFLENSEQSCTCGAPAGPHRKTRTLAARRKLAMTQIEQSFEADRRAAGDARWRAEWRDEQRRIMWAIDREMDATNGR